MKKVSLIALLFAFTSIAQAAEPTTPSWETTGSTDLSFVNTWIGNDRPSSRELKFNLGAYSFVTEQFEFGAGVAFDLKSQNGATATNLAIMAVPTWNFMSDIANSVFVRAGLGFDIVWPGSGIDSAFLLTYMASIGKRFEIVHNITWTPELGIVGTTSKTYDNGMILPSTLSLVVTPIQFSLLF